jgi:hypothetical protein
MEGDGMGGMVLWIMLGVVLIIALATVLPALLGWMIARRLRLPRRGQALAATAAALFGAMTSLAIVLANFRESTWNPPPRLTFNVPAGFAGEHIVLLQDPSSLGELDLRGMDVPLMAREASIDLPASGIVRIRDASALHERGTIDAHLSDGSELTGFGSGPGSKRMRATAYLKWERVPAGSLPVDKLSALDTQDGLERYVDSTERAAGRP